MTPAIAEIGNSGAQGEEMVVVENTTRVHNLFVCTHCSCYPCPVLGLPPVWYKAAPYRARAVSEQRAVLAEFGVEIGGDAEVRVWDSTAEVRYMVFPERPAGTEGLRGDELAALVTRDATIGTALVGGVSTAFIWSYNSRAYGCNSMLASAVPAPTRLHRA